MSKHYTILVGYDKLHWHVFGEPTGPPCHGDRTAGATRKGKRSFWLNLNHDIQKGSCFTLTLVCMNVLSTQKFTLEIVLYTINEFFFFALMLFNHGLKLLLQAAVIHLIKTMPTKVWANYIFR